MRHIDTHTHAHTHTQVGAIFHAGQPSVTVLGMGDLIFGERVPSGRMVQVGRKGRRMRG